MQIILKALELMREWAFKRNRSLYTILPVNITQEGLGILKV